MNYRIISYKKHKKVKLDSYIKPIKPIIMIHKLEEMVSESCYNEIVKKLKEYVSGKAFLYIFPAVRKALEEGSGKVRKEILINWLDIESCRVCDECGAIMQKGWYNMGKYACCEECVIQQESITRKEFVRYQIYEGTIQEYLDNEREGRKAEGLTQEEIATLLDVILPDCDAYYTEWG